MDAQGLFAELKRRRVIRAVVGYGIGAFAVLQIIEPIMHGLHWSDAVLSYVVAALAVGFPVVVSLAWIFDVNAGRIERTGRTGPLSHLTGRQLALVLIGIGALAAAPGTIWYFLVRGIGKPLASSAPAAERAAPSIAVLPFVNLSSDKEQEYFSDGIAEEILNALAQVEGLHVAGRTSSFYFKGKNEDLVSIAEKLHVATLLEGSVRKSGDRVRITAQLINAKDGYHLWSKQYDRELTDIFKVQGELAAAVVEALKVKLLPGTDVAAKVRAARDPEAYRLILLGRSLIFQGTAESAQRATAVLERAVALEPTYAPGWLWLATARGNAVLDAPRSEIESRARACLEAAERAVAADPADPGGYSIRGWTRGQLFWDWAGGESDLQRAFALNGSDPLALHMHAILLQKLGHLKEATAAERKSIETEPLSTVSWTNLGSYLLEDGQLEAARDAFLRSREISPQNLFSAKGLAMVELLEGHPAPALAAYERLSIEADRLQGIAAAQHELGHTAESQKALDALTAKADGPEADIAYRIATVHAWRGDKDRAFAWLDRAFARRELQLRFLKVDPLLRSLRADPRYRALLEKMKLPLD